MLAVGRERVGTAILARGAPTDAALLEGDEVVTYAELASRVGRRREELALSERSLVVLKASTSIGFVTTYLAILAGDHVPLLAGEHAEQLAATWAADALIDVDGDELHIVRRPGEAGRALHPDLALLLSTSGSTGSPKLVRLSHANVLSNAASIASYLGLTAGDRAITTLPLHYCYGLSVLHSHLLVGGSIVTLTASVVDPCFAAAMGRHEVTNVAGVPHTYELLEHAGPELVHVPSLRFMTQAGGRLRPDRVQEWLGRTRDWGIDLYIMYGQTEATARMAYLPPELASRHPQAIGRPIPGGELEVRPLAGMPDGVGELVYRGPNVMLGYATAQGDLAQGAVLDELATGDLARFHADDGVFEIVGRTSRFVKPFGLRVDLDAVEAHLASEGIESVVAGDDERLVVCAPSARSDDVRQRVADLTGLPLGSVHVDTAATPRTPAGKVDYERVRRRADEACAGRSPWRGKQPSTVAGVFGTVLGRTVVPTDSTFVSLGGDSLSYVECSVRLERLLGHLPPDWHLTPVAELEAVEHRRAIARLDTTVVLRTAGILAVVATHMRLWYFPGGSHLMLAVVGYNLARFHLSIEGARDRVRAALRTVGRIAVPVVAFVGACMVLVGGYSITTLTLVNNYLGPEAHENGRWHYWFIEALIQLTLLTALVLAIPPVRRFERRFPYLFPLVLLAGALTFRYHWLVIEGLRNLRFRTHGVAWFFVLGWLAQRSSTPAKRIVTTLLCLLTIPGFFGRPEREWFVAVGIVLLVWSLNLPLPRAAIRPIAIVAAASMWIYLSHFRIWPPLDRNVPQGVAYTITILAGVAIWQLTVWLPPLGRRVASSLAHLQEERAARHNRDREVTPPRLRPEHLVPIAQEP